MKAILCIDDDNLITQMVRFQLTKSLDPNDWVIESVNDPTAVIGLIGELRSNEIPTYLMIVDYQMPVMNGAQVIREVKKQFPDISCIILSGQANNTIVSELENEGLIAGFIHKPWKETDLMDKVLSLL